MVNERLYPPQINGTIPAFYKTYDPDSGVCRGALITIPFSMNQAVGESQFNGFLLKIKTVQTGTYLFEPQSSQNYNLADNTVTFSLGKEEAELLNEGQYYKIQLAYFSYDSKVAYNSRTSTEELVYDLTKINPGYYSTVGIIKCVSKPSVTIKGFSIDGINLFKNEIFGIYSVEDKEDLTERVYSYNFKFYDEDNNLYYDSGEIIHNASQDSEYSMSMDSITLNNFIKSKKIFSVVYTVTTMNGLIASSPYYKVTADDMLAPVKGLDIIATGNYENGYVNIHLQGLTEFKVLNEGTEKETIQEAEQLYNGEYLITRSSEEDNYTEWLEIKRFRLENTQPSTISFNDFSVKQGVNYIYSIQQYNMWGLYSSRILSQEVSIDFEDMYLYDGNRSLKIKFNPKVSSFKTNILEQKVDTIGNKYPFIFRNGNVSYKEFPISGLISYRMDDEMMFYDREIHEYIRHTSIDKNESRVNEEQVRNILEHDPAALNEYNIHTERDFKMQVLDWLNDGKPKLFRSATEGNFIVRLMNVNLQPVDALGRMLHSFTCNAYEIADFNYKNLIKYGFVKASDVTDFVSLWKSYNLGTYAFGADIVINFEQEVSRFQVQDMMPGSKLQIFYSDTYDDIPDIITIGSTGAYLYEGGSRKIVKIIIDNSIEKQFGVIECQYKGIRYSQFDAITDVALKTIISNQYIGVDPKLLNMKNDNYLETYLEDGTIFGENEKHEGSCILDLNIRTLLNEGRSTADGFRKRLNDFSFEPGDIIQYINAEFFNQKNTKIRILNLEKLHLRKREIFPIYRTPYKLIPNELWDKLPEYFEYGITESEIAYKQKYSDSQNLYKYSQKDYDSDWYPVDMSFYSMTPFGVPYSIDELTPFMYDNYVMNDLYPIFLLYEYDENINEWIPRQKAWYISSGTKHILNTKGKYYDAYWNNLSDEYNTKFYINNKYIYYSLMKDIKPVFKDNSVYCNIYYLFDGNYIMINNLKDLLNNKNNLYIREPKNEFMETFDPNITKVYKHLDLTLNIFEGSTIENNIFENIYCKLGTQYIKLVNFLNKIFIKVKNKYYNIDDVLDYNVEDKLSLIIGNNDNLIASQDYVKSAIKWKENYPEFFNPPRGWKRELYETLDMAKMAQRIIAENDLILYIGIDNSIDLDKNIETEYNNLGEVSHVVIGNGVIAEATFQLEILDYFTEEHDPETKEAKEDYITKAEFLRNLFRAYEVLAEADDKTQKYLALYKFYSTIIYGIDSLKTNNKEINYGNIDLESQITLQDRYVMNEILNYGEPRIFDFFKENEPLSDKEYNFIIEELRKLPLENNVFYNSLNLKTEQDFQNFETLIAKVPEDYEETEFEIITKHQIAKQFQKRFIENMVSKLKTGEIFKNSLKLTQDEIDDLNSLLELEKIESLNEKKNKISEVMTEANNLSVTNDELIKTEQSNFEGTGGIRNLLLEAIKSYNSEIVRYKSDLWIMNLIQKLANEYPPINNNENTQYLESIQAYYKELLIKEGSKENTYASSRSAYVQQYTDYYKDILLKLNTIKIYQKIIDDEENDDVLDEHIYDLIVNSLKNILIELKYLDILKYNINILSQTEENEDLTGNNYLTYLEDSSWSLENIINQILDNKYLFSTPNIKIMEDIGKSFNLAYSLYSRVLLESLGENIILTDSLKDQIKNYIYKVDELEYLKEGFDLLSQKDNSLDFFENIKNSDLEEKENISQDNYTILIEYRKNPILSTYLLQFKEDEIKALHNSRKIIEKYTLTEVFEGNDIFNSKYFDGFDGETVKQKLKRIDRIKQLVQKIDEYVTNKNQFSKTDSQIFSTISNGLTTSFKNIINYGFNPENGLLSKIMNYNMAFNSKYFFELMFGEYKITRPQFLNYIEEFVKYYNLSNDNIITNTTILNLFGNDQIENIDFSSCPELNNTIYYKQYVDNALTDLQDFRTDLSPIFSDNSLVPDSILIADANRLKSNVLNITDNITDDKMLAAFIINFSLINEYELEEIKFDFLGTNTFIDENKKEGKNSGIFYWYLENVLGKTKDHYDNLYSQSKELFDKYNSLIDNYLAKRDLYLENYNEFKEILEAFKNTEVYAYYVNTSANKEELINKKVREVKTAWGLFVLALDRGFTAEYNGGMYR